MKEFETNKETKDMIEKISSLFGVKSNIVKEVWEYTLFVWFLKLSENPEKLTTIRIPFLGNVGIKFDSESLDEETGKVKTNIKAFLSVDDEFKEMYGNIYAQSESELAEYIQKKYIKGLLNDIELS